MAQKKSNWGKEVKSGLFLAFIICTAIFILLLLSFFDLYTMSNLRLNQAKMYSDKIYRQESLRAEALFDEGELNARKDFLNAYQSAMVDFNHSCPGGIYSYWSAFGKYWESYLSARKVYHAQVAALNKEREMIRTNASQEGEQIMKKARSEIDPLYLIFKGKERGRVLGYFYDPASGRLEPQVGVINKGKISNEKK